MRKRTKSAGKGDTRSKIVDAARDLFLDNEREGQPSVRDIAEEAEVAPGMVTHHFSSYSGLMAELNAWLYGEHARKIGKFDGDRNRTRQQTAIAYFRELAKLDLDDKYKRLRRATGRASWDWHAQGESALVENYTKLLQPLRDSLRFEKTEQADDILTALWAIYQHTLRLALINALLPPSADKSGEKVVDAIEAEIKRRFALILKE